MGAAACPGPELGAAEGPLRGDTSGGSRSREGRAGGTPGPLPDSGGCPGAAPRPRCPSLLQVAADSARRPPGGRPGAGGAAPAPGPPGTPPRPPVPVPGPFGTGRNGGCRAPAVYRLYLRVN